MKTELRVMRPKLQNTRTTLQPITGSRLPDTHLARYANFFKSPIYIDRIAATITEAGSNSSVQSIHSGLKLATAAYLAEYALVTLGGAERKIYDEMKAEGTRLSKLLRTVHASMPVSSTDKDSKHYDRTRKNLARQITLVDSTLQDTREEALASFCIGCKSPTQAVSAILAFDHKARGTNSFTGLETVTKWAFSMLTDVIHLREELRHENDPWNKNISSYYEIAFKILIPKFEAYRDNAHAICLRPEVNCKVTELAYGVNTVMQRFEMTAAKFLDPHTLLRTQRESKESSDTSIRELLLALNSVIRLADKCFDEARYCFRDICERSDDVQNPCSKEL